MSQPLRGFVGQRMGGSRDVALQFAGLPVNLTSGSGSVTVRRSGWALIMAEGPGGSGAYGSTGSGGGGGAALYKAAPVVPGQVISYAIGTPGAAPAADGDPGNDATDTTVTLPSGIVLRAGGGKLGASSAPGGAGGIATGGDINRTGGQGGTGGTATAGSPGERGGAGGALSGNMGGGGGGAGLPDILADFTGGNGGAAGGFDATGPGGGSGAVITGLGKAGAAGRLVIIFATTLR